MRKIKWVVRPYIKTIRFLVAQFVVTIYDRATSAGGRGARKFENNSNFFIIIIIIRKKMSIELH